MDGLIGMHSAFNSVHVTGSLLTPEEIETIRGLLKREGYAYLVNISDGFPYLAELSKLGTPIPHHGNDLVKDIKPDPRIETEHDSALTMGKLPPHTDWYEVPGIPPRYVVLWGIHESHGEGGETILADGYTFLESFNVQDQKLMRKQQYEWTGLPNIAGGPPEAAARHPILEQHPDGLIMRYSSHFLRRTEGDNLVSRYTDGGASFFEAKHVSISITRNSVLLWDNWRMIHGRNAFNDPGRHLRRVLLSL